jgi:hypothetical protein|tara:strand:+ start:1012 stop:1122 length:111 start_codon:yes stop_codon:yes gene_type:complete
VEIKKLTKEEKVQIKYYGFFLLGFCSAIFIEKVFPI